MTSDLTPEKALLLENQFSDENELILSCREVVSDFLFLIHTNDSPDIISYFTNHVKGKGSEEHIISCCKVLDISRLPKTAELSLVELMMTYGAKMVPNHDRDFPDVTNLTVPISIIKQVKKIPHGAEIIAANGNKTIVGYLVGAFEVPIIPEVLIDIWSAEVKFSTSSKTFKYLWATTTIDHVNFAVLERIFVTNEVSWGVSNVVQIDIFGRNPRTGYLIIESIVATPE